MIEVADAPAFALTAPLPPVKHVVEGALLAANGPLTPDQLLALFTEAERPERAEIGRAVAALRADYEGRAIELIEVAGGFRVQVRASVAPWVARLWEERPARYSRALLETLALIAYRQPITRGEIEDIRGVAVGSQIIRTLTEREWVRVVGHRDVPGRPELLATTRRFLDYFGLRSLNDLPPLAAIRDPALLGADFLDDAAPDDGALADDGPNRVGPVARVGVAEPPAAAAAPAGAAPITLTRSDAAEDVAPPAAAMPVDTG